MNNEKAQQAEKALRKAFAERNLPLSKLPWVMAQVAHETGGFTSRVSSTNNLSGIKYVPGNKFGAVKGILSPEGDYYAAYPSYDNWARQYLYEITKKINPLAADTIEGFVSRLKQNGYFGATESSYLAALKSWKNTITKFLKMNWPEIATGSALLLLVVAIGVLLYIQK